MPRKPISSSTGTKFLIAATGLGLYAFLILHLANNLLVFAGPQVFNQFAHVLVSSPLVLGLEVTLAAIFVAHIYKASRNFVANKNARPVPYHKKGWERGKSDQSRKTLASATMIGTGLITLAFLILHLRHFRFGAHYEVEGTHVRDLYRLEMELFSNPFVVGFYVVGMIVIGFHLWHGFWSAFQSLGLGNSRYTPALVRTSKILAIVIAGGFLIIPLLIFNRIGVTP